MGRKLKQKRTDSRQIGISYVADKDYFVDKSYLKEEHAEGPDMIAGDELIEEINKIAIRERVPRSEIIVRALATYWICHGKGNYQTIFDSYMPGGHKSDGQLEQEVINTMLGIPEWHDIKWSIIRLRLKEIGYPMEKLHTGAERVAKSLNEAGRKVWR